MVAQLIDRDSITFKPEGLIIGGTEKKLSSVAKIKIDVFGVGQLFIRDNDINYNFGTNKLSGIRYGDVLYDYNDEVVRNIVNVYGKGACFYCKKTVPITSRNIIGLQAAKFIMFCPHCNGLTSYWIEKDRVKPVVIVKPSAVVQVETVLGSVYDVFPGTFRGTDASIVFYGVLKTAKSSLKEKFYKFSMDRDKIKNVTFHNGKKIDLGLVKREEVKAKNKKKINPNDVVVLYSKGDICYQVINVLKCKGNHLYFNASKRGSVDGRVYKITLPITSIESIVVGRVMYKMCNVEFEVVE